MDRVMSQKMSMPEGQLLMLLKEIYGSHVQWHGVQLQRVQMLVCKVEEIEREECARLCEDLCLAHPGRADLTADQCAAAIRNRGQQKHE